ncbi:MAG: hypothetical protein ACR2LG_08650, partial [Actinomycetota bacterium]
MCVPGTVEAVRARADVEGPAPITRRAALAAAAGAAAVAVLPAPSALARRIPEKQTSDLTHVFTEGFPVYTFDPPRRRTLVTVEDDGFY